MYCEGNTGAGWIYTFNLIAYFIAASVCTGVTSISLQDVARQWNLGNLVGVSDPPEGWNHFLFQVFVFPLNIQTNGYLMGTF